MYLKYIYVKALVSLNDLELPIIANNKSKLEEAGVTVIVSGPEVVNTCFDKWKTRLFLDSINVKTPKTYISYEDAKKAIKNQELNFPLVIKPRWGSASIGIEFPESEEDLELAFRLLSLRLSKTILADVSRNDIEHAILIQEKLTGQEYGMDVMNDLNGGFIASFTKMKLAMRDGETDKAISVYDERFNEVGRKLGEGLKHIGNLDVDIFETDAGLYVLELNPRFGGGYPFTHESGVNLPKILIELINGNRDIDKYLSFSPDKTFAKCDRMVLIPSIK